MREFGDIAIELLAPRVARAVLRLPVSQCVDEALLRDFTELLDWLEDSEPCDVLIFTLATPRADVRAQPAAALLEQCGKQEKLMVRLDRLSCISVAAIDGACSRFWLQLALACDHRIASDASTFQIVELKEGVLPGMNVFRLAKYLGIGVARRMIFTAEKVAAAEALSLGVVDRICRPGALNEQVTDFIHQMSPIHATAAGLARRLLNESFATSFEDFIGQYLACQHRCLRAVHHSEESPS